jgi:hypothetical protein
MFRTRLIAPAAVLVALGAAGMSATLARPPAAGEGQQAELSPAEFGRLLHQLDPGNQPWTTIPWKVSVTEARRLAARERKPIFLVVNTGNCLGFV